MRSTYVLGRRVPVKSGKSPVRFHAGRRGLKERGTFNFWTVVILRRKWPRLAKGVARTISTIGDPGERFRRSRDSIDKRFFDETRPLFVRPATRCEISLWMGMHIADARYVRCLRRFLPFVRRKPWVERWLAEQGRRAKSQDA